MSEVTEHTAITTYFQRKGITLMDTFNKQSQVALLVGDCLLTLREVAPLIGKSVGACRKDLHRGKFLIVPFRLGRSIRFRLSDVRRFMASGGGVVGITDEQ